MGNIIKKIGAFSIGPIVGAFLGLITIPLITYFISPEEYGRASMFTLAQGIAIHASLFWIRSSICARISYL